MKYLLLSLALLTVGCSSPNVVVVYSPHGKEMLGDYEKKFEEAYPEVDLQWFDLGAQEVYGKIRNERNRPAADVWWGAPSTMFIQAAEEGLLEPYTPSWASAVPAEFKAADNTWFATFRSPLAILFNTRTMKKEDMPKTWDALLEPQWQGKIALRQPLPSGTMRTFLSAMILRAPDEAAGFAWQKKLHEATASYPESPQLLYDHIKKNADRISVWLQPDIVMQRDRNGYPFGYAVPEKTPVLTDGIAIVKGAPHPDWAQRFYEFVTSEEALVQQAHEYAKMPARTDLDADQLPGWMTEEEVTPMRLDWDRMGERQDAWMERWENEVYSPK
ncbi:MAG: extracellular solute-binding protein [Candidatus Hydrogenedentes bacterium]|nr:extracellular solute-binding protein [Candidatus Hydrogenedentota bacterium]